MRASEKRLWIVLGVLLAALFFVGLRQTAKNFIDYPVYETAARKILEGQPQAIYDVTRQTPGGYYYPFAFAAFFVPFAALGAAGRWLFYFLFFAAWLFVLRFAVAYCGADNGTRRLAVACLVSVSLLHPVNDAFMNANIGLLLCALAIAAFLQASRRPVLGGALLGTAIAFKVYPLLLLGYFVAVRRWRVVAATLATAALLGLLLPVALYGSAVGGQLLRDQWTVMTSFGSHWSYDSLVFQNWPGSVMRWAAALGFEAKTAFRPALLVGCGALVAYCAPSFLWPRHESAAFRTRLFLLVLAAVPVLVPVSWYNMAVFYAPVIALTAERAFFRGDTRARVAFALFVVLYDLTTSDLVGRRANDALEFASLPFLGVLAPVMYVAWATVREFPESFRVGARSAVAEDTRAAGRG